MAERLGGVSVATIMRLESEGRLHPIRLRPSKHSTVFYDSDEGDALVADLRDRQGSFWARP